MKLDNDDKQNWRSRLKEIITQKIKSQSIAPITEKSIKEIVTEEENEQDLRSQLKKGIIQRTEPLSTAQTPFIKEMKTDEEQKEIETDEETVKTTEEQTKRRELIHVYLTSTMEKEENKQEEQNRRKELLHVYSKLTMDNEDKQTEQDEMETYLRTSTEEELKSSMEEEYDEDEPFEENNNEGK
jgi:hypothetical protein